MRNFTSIKRTAQGRDLKKKVNPLSRYMPRKYNIKMGLNRIHAERNNFASTYKEQRDTLGAVNIRMGGF
jgi:hypothetical protein